MSKETVFLHSQSETSRVMENLKRKCTLGLNVIKPLLFYVVGV